MATISGGDKLEAYLAGISAKVSRPASLKVGFFGGATYPDGTSVAAVASFNEFGVPSRGQPPRPFFRDMVAAKSKSWPKAIADRLKVNDYDATLTLEQVGEGIAGQLRQSIADFSGAPLAPSTIKRKGSAKALVDTGQMLASVGHEVTSGE